MRLVVCGGRAWRVVRVRMAAGWVRLVVCGGRVWRAVRMRPKE
ncbi:hypothetical protein [Amycolatopsis sp. cg9]